MEILNIVKNKNFRELDKDTYLSVNTGKIIHIDNYDEDMKLYNYGKIATYKSGLLCVDKKRNSIRVFFITNNGKKLFETKVLDMQEMENTIYDINAHACSSGVLVCFEDYKHKCYYEYYTYNGAKVTSSDFNDIKEKIDAFESNTPIFTNINNEEDLDR